MNTQKSVFNKISKIEREVESKEVELSEVQKVELGITQDIQSDIDSVKSSLNSVRRVIIDAEIMLGKNAKVIQTIKKAIDRVESTAKEIGADEVLKMVQKQKSDVQELEKNISKTIVGIGNASQNIV